MTPLEIEVLLDEREELHRGDSPFSRDKARVDVLSESGTFDRLGELMANAGNFNSLTKLVTDQYEWFSEWAARMPLDDEGKIKSGTFIGWCMNQSMLMNGTAVPECWVAFSVALCERFRVPPVMVEILLPSVHAPSVWRPPSPQLASAVLREAAIFHEQFDVSHWFQLMAQVSVWPLPAHELLMAYHEANEGCADATRNLHPDATAFRVRLGATGDWHERPL